MSFNSDKIKQACNGHGGFEYDKLKCNNVHNIYWRTDNNEYVASFCDIEDIESRTYDVRVFRIWKRNCASANTRRSEWEFFSNDYLFSFSDVYPLAMLIEYVGDYDEVQCAFPINDWQLDTLLGNFNK